MGDENRITSYVLGQLARNDPDFPLAQQETDEALKQGRRLTIAVREDDLSISFEKENAMTTSISRPLNNVFNPDTNIQNILRRAPTIDNDSLEFAIKCNLINFTGKVS